MRELPPGIFSIPEDDCPLIDRLDHNPSIAPRFHPANTDPYVYGEFEQTTTMISVSAPPRVTLASKLDFLRRPEAFPDHPSSVDVIETHFAWVFLSKRFVYKLKKPLRFQNVDFTHLQTRRSNCELEVTLNRRLAERVYIGVVPLSVSGSDFFLEGNGEPVEWLVKMHRLPLNKMLDQAARTGEVSDAELSAVIKKLGHFYRRTARARWDATAYCERLDQQVRYYGGRLAAMKLGALSSDLEQLTRLQRRFIRANSSHLHERLSQGRIVDAHGDLRPEHIFLADDPQIIDCLEFSSDLRLLDSAEEVAFLVLECERIGQAAIAKELLDLYLEVCDDPISPELLRFYRSLRALVRALLSAWHLEEDLSEKQAAHWSERAGWYLRAARASIEEALA